MKRSPSLLSAAGAGLVLALGLAMPVARGDVKPATIDVDDIKEGMKGYGLTVFHGYEPERFDVEVIGVLHHFRAGQDLILVKTPHPRLNITKNVQGMSGSPIYLDGGRLAGAYAYSLRMFMVEPVAGITPIAPMLTELHRPLPPGFWPLEGQPPLPMGGGARQEQHASRSPTQWNGAPGTYDIAEHAKQLAASFAPGQGSLVPVETPLMIAGMTEHAVDAIAPLLRPLGLEPLQAGGAQTQTLAGAPDHFVDGGSLGIQMVRGDVSAFGFGTVTHVEGTRLCGFGHPMMEAGDTDIPAAIARVMWIYASEQHSFKVGESARVIGALVNDRQSAVVIDSTKTAPTFPLHLDIKGVTGAPKTSWDVQIGEEKFMSAALSAAVIASAIEATVSDKRDISWTLRSHVTIHGHGAIDLDDYGVAIGGMPETGDWLSSRVVRALAESLNNPWGNVHVDGVQGTLEIHYERDIWRLRGVELLDPVVDAGEKARVALHFRPFSGPEVVRTAEIAVPAELAGHDVEVEILPGYEVVPDVAPPENLDQILANATRQTFLPKSVVLQLKLPAQGVAFAGHVATRLPGFALDALRTTTSDIVPEVIASYVRSVTPTQEYVDGHDKVKIKVRAKLR